MAELIDKNEVKEIFPDNGEGSWTYNVTAKAYIDSLPTTTEAEIRAMVIDEFAEKLKERLTGMQMVELQGEDVCPCAETGEECPYMNQDIGCQYCAREQTIKDIDEIAEQLKEGE